MKFSILLPTRNRLDLLKYALETVVRQNYQDWEIIVYDNFSEEPIGEFVASIDDKRIHYYRTTSLVPVTENWNNALYESTGEYIIMLGDDDCLMKESLLKASQLIDEYHEPDFIYSSSLLYAYPGVIPQYPEGFLNSYAYAEFLSGIKTPFFLEKEMFFGQNNFIH